MPQKINTFSLERERKAHTMGICRSLRNVMNVYRYAAAVISKVTLRRVFRPFEHRSEAGYFICKDAKTFPREHFDLWAWRYFIHTQGNEPKTEWTEDRLKQLQAIEHISYHVLNLIATFEDELLKIWDKPKFVFNSNYVITLDRIAKQKGGIEVIEKVLNHKNFDRQVAEWKKLGIVDEGFRKVQILENTEDGKRLNTKYQFLPIDTKYFKDLELDILELFDDLDMALDGWLIKSENYQALNTILPKFTKGKYFYTVILPRMKKVLAYDKTGVSKEKDVKEKYNRNKAGGFFKYCELEQYEDALS